MELEPEPNMEREKRGARAKYWEKKGEPEPNMDRKKGSRSQILREKRGAGAKYVEKKRGAGAEIKWFKLRNTAQNPGIIHNHKFFGDVPCIVDLKTGVATTPKWTDVVKRSWKWISVDVAELQK